MHFRGRHIAMVLAGGIAGLASGFLWMIPNGLMGGALGMCLALGIVFLEIQQRQIRPVTRRNAILVGAFAGALGGACMTLLSEACASLPRREFGPPILPFWTSLAIGPLYGALLAWAYQLRYTAHAPFSRVLALACGGCFIMKFLATALYLLIIDSAISLPNLAVASLLLSLFSAVPFAAFWIIAMAATDPCWKSAPRTESITQLTAAHRS